MEHRWEYLRLTILSSRFDEEMARHGNEGWELACCPHVELDPHFHIDYYLCIFKRPKGGT